MPFSLNPLKADGLVQKDTVAHAIIDALKRHGITTTFGQSLPSMLHLAAEQAGIKQIAYRTENAGGYMADAFARVTNTPAIVTAQNGPAATLLVPPLAEAMKVSIPVIALVQDVNRDQTDKNAFQELDHIELFKPVTKWVRRVTEANRIEDYIDQAFAIACSGRPGPVALLLPADLLVEPRQPANRTHSLGHFPLDRTVAADEQIQNAARLLAQAKQPLIIAGGGVHISQACDAIAQLQEQAHLPVATTVMGKGSVDERHPLSVGVVGYFMGPNSLTRYQRPMVEEADVILLVGTRTNQNATDSWTLYPENATYIHLDVDGLEVGRNYDTNRLVGDAKLTLEALLAALENQDLGHRQAQRRVLEEKILAGKEKGLEESESVRLSDAKPIRPERIMHELQAQLQSDDIVVADASYSSIWVANNLSSLKPGQRFLCPRGLAGLGWGFPMAMGAKLAAPEAEVYAVVGDGGFAHVWGELETANRMGIKTIVILLNNGILGYQKHAENVKFGAHTSAVHFAPVDHAAIARASGCEAIVVTEPDDIADALAKARQNDKTTLIEIFCDENAYPPITSFTPDATV